MNKQSALRKSVVTGFRAVTLSMLAFSVGAMPLVKNGSFEDPSGGTNTRVGVNTVTDWHYDVFTPSGGIAFIYAPGAADTYGQGLPYLWGPGNSSPNVFSPNGLTDTSPDGGNYIASDSDPLFSGAFSQSIVGLIPGKDYMLRFWYAAAQFSDDNGNWNGKTDSRWDVSLGGAGSYSSPTLFIDSHGFSGWKHETKIFTIPTTSSGTELLKFFAVGHPGGSPPVALLDGVSITAVLEPETFALLGIGLLGILAISRQKKKRA